MPIRVVMFDVGGTILRVHPSVGAVYAETARARGVEVSEESIAAGFRSAWKRSQARGLARNHVCTEAILRDEWFHIVRETFGAAVEPGQLPGLFDELYEKFVSPGAWRLVPGFRETLSTLRRMGLRLGILSNWDSRLRPLLAQLGLLAPLDFTIISSEVGHEKPHERIFQVALAAAAARSEEVLHVGDSWSADIEPARALGIQTLWIAAPGDRQRYGDAAQAAIDELPENPEPFWPIFLASRP